MNIVSINQIGELYTDKTHKNKPEQTRTMKNSNLKTNVELIEHLQNTARQLLDALIPSDAEVVLLDYPHYPNVGDSLIWLGEIAYLQSRGLSPVYVCDFANYSVEYIRKIQNKNTIILINGGGNFGTLWKHLHDFKLKVLSDFPNTPVIQLPQTIQFDDDSDATQKTAEVIKQHGNFTLLVRCQRSFDFASKHFDAKLALCPDMAFFIGEIQSKNQPVKDRFFLLRTDSEKKTKSDLNPMQASAGKSYEVGDWLDVSRLEHWLIRVERHHKFRRALSFFDPSNSVLLKMWNLLCTLRMKRGVSKLSKGKVVVTDRLHAHILSVLMTKPHILLYNSYGKLQGFYDAWTKDLAIARFLTDANQVARKSEELFLMSRK